MDSVVGLGKQHGLFRVFSFGLCFSWGVVSGAVDLLPDPTRPPAELMTQQPIMVEEVTETEVVPVLQSVLLSRGYAAAIINGQTVKLGDYYGGARLVKVSPYEAVLRSGDTSRTLKLFPGVEKQSASPKISKRRGSASRKAE